MNLFFTIMSNRQTGTVQWFDDDKGFGFIDHEGTEEDIFVHFSEIDQEGFKQLDEGDRVEFTPKDTDKGLQAASVIQIGQEEQENKEPVAV